MECLDDMLDNYDFGEESEVDLDRYVNHPIVIDEVDENSNLNVELEWLMGRDGDKTCGVLRSLEEKCLTSFGKRVLLKETCDLKKENIGEIQREIGDLLGNREKLMKIRKQLNKLKEFEKDLLWLWNVPEDFTNNVKSSLLFDYPFGIGEFLNNRDWVLTWLYRYKLVGHPIITILGPFTIFFIALIVLMYYKVNISWKLLTKILMFTFTYSMQNVNWILLGVYVGLYLYSVYESVHEAFRTDDLLTQTQIKLNSLNKLIEICDELDIGVNDCHKECMTPMSNNLWSEKGLISKSFQHWCLNGNYSCWQKIMEYLGYLDMLQVCCELLESKEWCMVKILKEGKLRINGLWNPVLKNKIRNNCILSKHEILTGPNASGKSTYLRSVGVCVRFAQTLGIAPANNMELVPYDNIWTSFRIPDKQGSRSLFESELYRCEQVWNQLKSTQSNRTLLLLDEMMSSTNFIEGYSLSRALLMNLTKFDNCDCIVATHFHGLSSLGKNKKYRKYFQNVSFEVQKDLSDNRIYTYKKVKKSNNDYTALELVKEKGWIDGDVLNDAIKEKNKLVSLIDKVIFS